MFLTRRLAALISTPCDWPRGSDTPTVGGKQNVFPRSQTAEQLLEASAVLDACMFIPQVPSSTPPSTSLPHFTSSPIRLLSSPPLSVPPSFFLYSITIYLRIFSPTKLGAPLLCFVVPHSCYLHPSTCLRLPFDHVYSC